MKTLYDKLNDYFVNEPYTAGHLMRCDNPFVVEEIEDNSEVIVCVYDGTEVGGDKSLAGIAIKYIDNYGGEDMGSEYWSIYKFSRNGVELYIKFEGYYASHYGSEYQGYKFVKPVEKTIIVYE